MSSWTKERSLRTEIRKLKKEIQTIKTYLYLLYEDLKTIKLSSYFIH